MKLMTDWKGQGRAGQGRGLRDITSELYSLNIRTPQGSQWYASKTRNQLKQQPELV